MKNKGAGPAWDDVLVGFASGADPIWQQYKEYVGPFHWTPWEVFNQNCPGESAGAAELTVVKTYKFEGYGCGLCQVGVPCEAGIPVKAARQALEPGEFPPPPLA